MLLRALVSMFKSHKHCLAQWPDCISKTNLLFVTALRRYIKPIIIKKNLDIRSSLWAFPCLVHTSICISSCISIWRGWEGAAVWESVERDMGGVGCWNINIKAAGKQVGRKLASSLAPCPSSDTHTNFSG